MGNSNKKPSDFQVVRSFNQNEWVNKQKRDGYQIWENISRNITAEVYPLKDSLSTAQLEHYEMRNKNHQYIVKVHNVRVDEKSRICSQSYPAQVFVQRIPARLNSVSDLNQNQGLYVLRSAYQGFNILNSFYGPIEPEQDLICFNQNGKVKVWATSNLSQIKNQIPKKQNNLNYAFINQERNPAKVNKILNIVQNRTLNKLLPEDLKNKFRQNNPTSYFQAGNLVDQYLFETRRAIPQSIPRIPQRSNYRISNGLKNSSYVQNYSINGFQPINASKALYSSQNPNAIQLQYQTASQSQFQSQNQSQAQTLYSFMKPVSTINNKINQIENSLVGFSTPQPLPIVYQTKPQVKQIIPQNFFGYQNNIPSQPIPINPQNIHLRQVPTNLKFQHPGNVLSLQTIKSNPNIASFVRADLPGEVVSPIKQIPASPIKQNKVNVYQESPAQVFDINKGILLKKPQQPVIQPQVRHFPPQISQPVQNNTRQHNAISFFNANLVESPRYSPGNFNFYNNTQQVIGFAPQIGSTRPSININQVREPQKHPQVYQQQNQIRNQLQVQPQPQPQFQSQIQGRAQLQEPQNKANSQPIPIPTQVKAQQKKTNSQKPNQQNRQAQITDQQELKYESNDYKTIVKSKVEVDSEQSVQDEAERQLQLLQQQKFFNQQEILQQKQSNQNREIIQNQIQYAKEEYQDERNYYPFGQEIREQQQYYEKGQTVEFIKKESQIKKQIIQTESSKQIEGPSVTEIILSNNQVQEINQDQQFAGYKNQAKINKQAKKTYITLSNQQSNKQNQIQQNQIQQNQSVQQSQQQSQPSQVHQDNSSSTPYVSSSTDYQYQYNQRNQPSQSESSERIPDNARYEDIQQYIRNKYKSYIGTGDLEVASKNFSYLPTQNLSKNNTNQFESSQLKQNSSVTPYNPYSEQSYQIARPNAVQMASYVQNKYDQFNNGSSSYVNKYDYSQEDIQFSFKPSQLESKNQIGKFQPLQSYQYMRIQKMEGSPGSKFNIEQTVKQNEEKNSNQKKQQGDDILDVKNMERSLDKKYSYIKSQQQIKEQNPNNENEQGGFEVKNLEQHLIRFEESRVGSGQAANTPQPRFETSQVSKIHSIDDRIGVNRRSSMNRDPIISFSSNFQVKSQYDYGKFNYGSYENQSPRKSGAKPSKVSRQLSSIDQKFSKYVQLGGATNVSAVKTALRQKQDNGYANYENGSSRMATGHFGFVQNDSKRGFQNQNSKYKEVNSSSHNSNVGGGSRANNNTNAKLIKSDVKGNGLTYEDLRKFMWS